MRPESGRLPRSWGDRFELLEKIGEGALGLVYRALDRRTGREVALKLLKTDLISPARLERFRREGQTTAVVDGARLSSHVRLPCIRTRLPATAGLFFTTEGPANLSTGRTQIHVGDATVRSHGR